MLGIVDQGATLDCRMLSGTGQVTHLGKTTIMQHTACIDGTDVSGTFIYKGRTGGMLEGSYKGTLEENVLEAKVTIEEAESIRAIQEVPEATPPGKGTMSGTLTETGFRYSIDGWLFHHTRE